MRSWRVMPALLPYMARGQGHLTLLKRPVHFSPPWTMQLLWLPDGQRLWFVATSPQVHLHQHQELSQSPSPWCPPPSDPSSLWRWLHLTGRLWSPVWGQGYKVLAFKDSKPRAAERAWEGSLLLLQLIREGPKWQCKNAQEGRLLHGVKHVFMCHVKVSTEVNEAGQSPAGLGHPGTPLQSGRHQVTSPPP